MAKRKIEIIHGGNVLLTLYAMPNTWDEADFALIDMEGMESWNNIEIETVPKLFSRGSYVVSKRVAEKPMTIEASVKTFHVRGIYHDLSTAALSLTPVTISMSLPAIETVDAYITGIDWNQVREDEADFTITLKSVSGTIN